MSSTKPTSSFPDALSPEGVTKDSCPDTSSPQSLGVRRRFGPGSKKQISSQRLPRVATSS